MNAGIIMVLCCRGEVADRECAKDDFAGPPVVLWDYDTTGLEVINQPCRRFDNRGSCQKQPVALATLMVIWLLLAAMG
jgi:hypothetical protein